MGLPFAVLRPIAALLTSVVGGCMVNCVCKEKDEPTGKVQNEVREKERKGGLKEVFRYGYVEMLQDIGKRLVLGLILAGLITIFVPESFFVQYADSSLKCMALVLLFSVPMYLCATGSIPIAVALMLKGLSPGAALVLLMAGPATNFAAILVVRKVLGVKALVVYLGTIIIGAIGFGLAIDYLLPQEWFLSDLKETAGHCGQTSWFKILSSVLFILLLLNAFFGKIGKAHHSCSCGGRCECVENDAKTYGVKGMSCNHCKANVERALLALEGVRSAAAKIEACEVAIVGDVDEAVVKKTVEELGFKFEGRKL
jgi:copper chaperone CopZ